MDWVQKRFSREEIMQNNRRKKNEKRDKKIWYHIKDFPENKIPRRVKMKAKIIGKIGIFATYFYEKKHLYNLWKRK